MADVLIGVPTAIFAASAFALFMGLIGMAGSWSYRTASVRNLIRTGDGIAAAFLMLARLFPYAWRTLVVSGLLAVLGEGTRALIR